jgi:heptosyltransferase I
VNRESGNSNVDIETPVKMSFQPRNVLVMDLGQIGDVILSLPALAAIRKRFAESKITILIGKSAIDVIELAEIFDQVISVDRVRLRDGNKLKSIKEIFKLVGDIRRRKFDFVIDLHSLHETNLLGFLSGAKLRLFAKRGTRSLDWLSNFRPEPPAFDKDLHFAKFYLNCLQPLGVIDPKPAYKLHPAAKDIEKVKNLLKADKIYDEDLVGINIGAGHPTRNWELAKFAELSRKLSEYRKCRIIIFFGPEEWHLEREIKAGFSPDVFFYHRLSLRELAASFTFLKVLIGNDSGPMHLGAIVGAPVLTITNPSHFSPLGDKFYFVKSSTPDKISVEEAFQKAKTIVSRW